MSLRHTACLQISVSIVEFFGPPRIRIIPNEVMQKRNIVVPAENNAGRNRGSVILKKVPIAPVPRIRDWLSGVSLKPSQKVETTRIAIDAFRNTCAIKIAHTVCRKLSTPLSKLSFENAAVKELPTTTVGNTKGIVTSDLRNLLPLN
jgi:hypothetical protein